MLEDIAAKFMRGMKKSGERAAGLLGDPASAARMLLPALAVASITLISYLSVGIVYKAAALAFTEPSAVLQPVSQESAPPEKPRTIADFDIVVRRNLFATAQSAVDDGLPQGGNAYITGEEYTAYDLKGTIASDDAFGFAVVEEKGKGKQKIYRIGDMIGSARLVRITRNAAMLTSGGRELVMRIKDTAEGGSLMTRSGRSDASHAPSGIAISREEVNRSLADLKSIMSQAVVRPSLKDGVQEGFMISNIVPGSLYEKLGLQNGDVIVDVNGKALSGADDLMDLVGTMQSGGGISVNLIRNGNTETLNYSFH